MGRHAPLCFSPLYCQRSQDPCPGFHPGGLAFDFRYGNAGLLLASSSKRQVHLTAGKTALFDNSRALFLSWYIILTGDKVRRKKPMPAQKTMTYTGQAHGS